METTTWVCTQDSDDLLALVHSRMGNARGTVVTRPTADTLEARATLRPGWTIWVAILLFPVGLIALLRREQRMLLFRVTPGPAGTLLRIEGATVPATQRALVALWGELSPTVHPVAA